VDAPDDVGESVGGNRKKTLELRIVVLSGAMNLHRENRGNTLYSHGQNTQITHLAPCIATPLPGM
jgi:hypothetical protein